MGQSILVVGLGNMGAALARTLINAGNQVSVWNRTSSKAKPLVDAGATLAPSVREGILANDFVVICVSNYDDTLALLKESADIVMHKTIIQLTTGSPAQAGELEDWMNRHGAAYLDGAIMAFPRDVGRETCTLLVAGSGAAWQRGEHLVKQLGGASVYLGTNVAAPASLDAGMLLPALAALIATCQGAVIVERAGMQVTDYADMVAPSFGGSLADDVRRQCRAIAANAFNDTEASLGVWAAGFNHFVSGMEAAGQPLGIAGAIRDLLNKAVDAGYGDEELAAVVKVLRD